MARMFIGVLTGILFAASAMADLKPQIIYGEDGRADVYQVQDAALKMLADSTVAQFRTSVLTQNGSTVRVAGEVYGSQYGLCKDEPFFHQPVAAICSGFLVGPDLIATAGHCIDAMSCASTAYGFGFKMQDSTNINMDMPASEIYRCKEVVARELTRQQDYALVRLDRPVVGHKILRLAQQDAQAGDPQFVIGHPAGLPTKVTTGAIVRSTNSAFYVTNLDTYGGNSGSAVFNARTGEVAGILVRGDRDFAHDPANQCVRSNVCAEDGCRGEDVTQISYINRALGAVVSSDRYRRY